MSIDYLTAHKLFQISTVPVWELMWRDNQDPVGYISEAGYPLVTISGVKYRLRDIVWLMVNGEWPQGLLDKTSGSKEGVNPHEMMLTNHPDSKPTGVDERENNGIGDHLIYLLYRDIYPIIKHRGLWYSGYQDVINGLFHLLGPCYTRKEICAKQREAIEYDYLTNNTKESTKYA